ncbi:hypothetical protein MIMGU_mgv1a013370mg [Erythranthe guttata]|uniref:Elongator complex protein 6 n=1 Tax=Erythranthe guttata TaxID=4155 RepID=A0A022RL10_ERYGU|nr:hypothetical protein MIMGU_mgv1a013370mg [Erythranthe guttata]
MANSAPSTLLDEALYSKGGAFFSTSPRGGGGGGRMILVEDCVETSGAFVLHHLLKRSLSPSSSDVVVFLSLAQHFSHYERILRKMKQVELNYQSREGNHVTLIIDDVSLMEVDANGSSNLVLHFLHYCCTLTAQFGCSVIALNHYDVYSNVDQLNLLIELEYLADVRIKVEPLATGLANDVHGQLTVSNKGGLVEDGCGKVHNFQFRIKDSGVEYFYPGSKS